MRCWKSMTAALVLAGLTALPQAQGAEMAGVAAGVTGSIQVARLTDTVGRDVVSGDEIFLGDSISSSADSQMQVLLLDETVFTIGPNSELVIDEFVYDPETNAGKVAAQVLKGAFRFTTGLVGQEDPDAVSIGTPLGTIGIRGTIVAGVVSGDQALVVLIGPGDEGATKERVGRIEVANDQGTVSISRSGYGTVLGADGPPSPPVAIPVETVNAILGAVGTDRQGRPRQASQSAAAETQEEGGDESVSEEDGGQESGDTQSAQSGSGSSTPSTASSSPSSTSGQTATRPASASPAATPVASTSLSGNIGGVNVAALAGSQIDVAVGGNDIATGNTATSSSNNDETEEVATSTNVVDGVTTISDLVSVTTGSASISGGGSLNGDQTSSGTFTFTGTFNFGNQTAQFQMSGSWTGTNSGNFSINAGPDAYTNIFEKGGERFSSFSDGDLEPFKDTDEDFQLNGATSGTVNLRVRNFNGIVAGALDTNVSIVDGTETITGSATATR